MASSAALTTTHLPRLRELLDQWHPGHPQIAQQAASNLTVQDKDVLVAFRTRPPLPNEAADKFPSPDEAETPQFCSGISVEHPGVFVAHVPAMKVTLPSSIMDVEHV